MPELTTIYKFADFTFNPAKRILLRNGEEISLINRDFDILLFLIENRPRILSKDEILSHVWGETFVAESSVEKGISSLRNILGDTPANSRFIKTVTKKGYGFVHETVETDENVTLPNIEKPVFQKSLSRHTAYILVSSLLYGLLFWVALLLEIAYRFDRFGVVALFAGVPVVLWIAATSFAGLSWTKNLVRQESGNAFFVGLAFFVGGAILLCLAMSYFLPNEPIPRTIFHTQPAFAAFLKNSLIYFLPLVVIFILIPFHFVCVRQTAISETSYFSGNGAINLRPSFLFGLLAVAAVCSTIFTFYLLDNLLPGQYHNLFVTLAFIRFFIYFGLGVICLLWYKSQRLSSKIPHKFS